MSEAENTEQAEADPTQGDNMGAVKTIIEYRVEDEQNGATIRLMAYRLSPEEHRKVLEELRGWSNVKLTNVDADSIVAEIRGCIEADLYNLLDAGWSF